MKKFTYSFLFLFILSAYVSLGANGPGKNVINIVPFYTEDFSSGIPSTWGNIDDGGDALVWQSTMTGASNQGLPVPVALEPTGTTASNGYVIFDSDEFFSSAGDGSLVTDFINCTGKSSVHLTFNELFVQYASSVGEVSVSNDSINWTVVYSAEAGLGQDESTPNPNAVDLDISAVADNEATVYIRFHYTGTGEYFWMVDDVQLYEVSSLDAGVLSIQSPAATCNSLTNAEVVCAEVKNFGTSALSNVDVSYVLDGGTAVTETIAGPINPGDTVTYCFTQTADLSASGSHTLDVSTSVLGDVDNSNDLRQSSFFVGPHSLPFTQGFEPSEDLAGWGIEDVNADDTTWTFSSSFPHAGTRCADYVNDVTSTGDDWLISPCIDFSDITYSYSLSFWEATFSVLTDATREVKLLTAQDPASAIQTLVTASTVTNPATSYVQNTSYFTVPSAGVYYIGWHVTPGTMLTSLKIDDVNVDFYVKASELTANGSGVVVYPNPNNGTFSVTNLKSFNGSAQVTVLDMMGRSVYEQAVNGLDKLTLNLENQAAGIYTVRISNDAQVITKLVSITK